MTGPDPILVVDNVSKRYLARGGGGQETQALRDVSVSLEPGESLGLIGPNGAGKSTLLRLIAGVTAPSSGSITRTADVTTVIELGAGLHPDLTGRESIDLLARLAHGREMRTGPIFDDVVDFAGLGEVLDRRTRTYSTGMIARLAFSVAVHIPAALLLVDEVLSVGDADFQRRSRERILGLRDAGTAIVIVSHDLDMVALTCNRSILLDRGRIEADGPSDRTIRRYRGEPERVVDNEGVRLRLLTPTTTASGSTLIAELSSDSAAQAEVQLVVPIHDGLETTLGATIVCGEATIDLPNPGRHRLSMPTDGLPPGAYELRVGISAADGRNERPAAGVPFTLTGPDGPNLIRLRSTVEIERVSRPQDRTTS